MHAYMLGKIVVTNFSSRKTKADVLYTNGWRATLAIQHLFGNSCASQCMGKVRSFPPCQQQADVHIQLTSKHMIQNGKHHKVAF